MNTYQPVSASDAACARSACARSARAEEGRERAHSPLRAPTFSPARSKSRRRASLSELRSSVLALDSFVAPVESDEEEDKEEEVVAAREEGPRARGLWGKETSCERYAAVVSAPGDASEARARQR